MANINILILSMHLLSLYDRIWRLQRQILTYKDGPRAKRVIRNIFIDLELELWMNEKC